jgi:creatinine amidohydrolase
MAVICTHWGRFGHPDGLISEHERQFGIHGGEVETSLMLHFRPELVRMENAQNFVSKAESRSKFMQPAPPHVLSWLAHDLNPHGVVGDATKGSAEKGEIICRHQVAGFVELLREFEGFSLDELYSR